MLICGIKIERGIICSLITLAILIAGLWPFNVNPVNKVVIIPERNGIRFYGQGIAVSAKKISIHTNSAISPSVTIELMVRPHREINDGVASILTLHDGMNEHILIGQWIRELIIRIPHVPETDNNDKRFREIGIDNALEKDTTRLLSLTSGNGSTTIYIDGTFMGNFPDFSLVPNDRGISGQLILGNSPTGTNSWNGTILGLAIYDRTVTDKEALDNYHAWRQNRASRPYHLGSSSKPIALYLFDEHGGKQIRDHSGAQNHLLVPATFQPILRTILSVPTKEQWFNRPNMMDISINILGFIPFGFFLSAWLRRTNNLPAVQAYFSPILLGACLSLAIELIQAYLPTRDSSLLDIFNNTLGTAMGVMLLKYAFFF